jgi:hypothetical protein
VGNEEIPFFTLGIHIHINVVFINTFVEILLNPTIA